jgi:Man1-Src1p-C-terminal domain
LEECPPQKRTAIWDRVKKTVEGNSNVRAAGGEVRGDFHRTWEWVGDLNAFMGKKTVAVEGFPEVEELRRLREWSAPGGSVPRIVG